MTHIKRQKLISSTRPVEIRTVYYIHGANMNMISSLFVRDDSGKCVLYAL